MTDREAMQMALDVLKQTRVFVTTREKIKHPEGTDWYDYTIEALRAALAQGEPEPQNHNPVAWMCPDDPERETAFSWKAGNCVDCGRQRVPVYAAPQQREWQGLTDEEIRTAASLGIYEKPLIEFARAIEAKLKEKNT